jgi:hypothetical protein
MKCISVYTSDFEIFSDIYEQVLKMPPADNEETQIEGITINGSGEVPDTYVDRLKTKPDVVVMKLKNKDITILQHRGMFEIFIPEHESMVH